MEEGETSFKNMIEKIQLLAFHVPTPIHTLALLPAYKYLVYTL